MLLLRHKGRAATTPVEREPLYRTAADASRRPTKEIVLTFVPYYTYANRDLTSLVVWVPKAGF